MAKRNGRNNKRVILKTAERLFAEKGFDGARVDEIASEADVNKALIYYYFDSKEDILESLLNSLLSDFIDLVANLPAAEYDFEDEEVVNEILNNMLDFVINKRDILKVALTESLKSDSKQSIVFKIGEVMMSKEIEEVKKSYRKEGFDFSEDKAQWIVTEFFTGFLPMINFVVFKEEVGTYFGINDQKMRQSFIDAFKQTHLNYHLNNYKG